MATESDNRNIATTKSNHFATCQPQISLMNPPPPPTGPLPTPFMVFSRSKKASRTSSKLTIGGAPVLVSTSSMDVDAPANQPSQAGGGDVVSRAVKGKGNMTMGSGTTTAGGKGVARTMDPVAINCTAPGMKLAQGQGPLIEAPGGAGGKGGADGDAEASGGTGTPKPANTAQQKTGGGDAANPAPCEGGHPVALETGYVIDEDVDLALPGVIPLVVKRSYSSQRHREEGLLGRGGWHLSLEQWVVPDGDVLSVRLEDGRDAYFDPIGPGERSFHRRDKLELFAERAVDGVRYRLWDLERRQWRVYVAQGGRAARLVAIADAYGNQIAFAYAGDKLQRVTDTAGRELRCVYDEGRQRYLKRIEVWSRPPAQEETEPLALQTWVDYAQDGDDCHAAATDAEGHAERYRYDVWRRMVQVTLKNGTSFYYEYEEEFGRCIKTWGDGGLHRVELDRREGNELYAFGNPEPRRIVYTDDGYALVEEAPDGSFRREKTYDDDRYVLTETNGAGETFAFTYDDRGHRTSVVDPAGNEAHWAYREDLPVAHTGRDGLTTRYEYDGYGALVAATYPGGERYAVAYDNHGRVEAIYDRDGLRFSFAYDAHHNLVSQTDARGATTRFWYDALGRPVVRQDALGRVTRVVYDRLGQPTEVAHADGTKTAASYGPMGNVVRYVDPLEQVTTMEYGGTGVLLKLTEPTGQWWRFVYDDNERLIRIENPKTERYAYRYDQAGHVVEERPFDGRILRYDYDAGERLQRLERPDETFRTFSYDPLGNVVTEHSSDGAILFSRDRLGRLQQAVVEEPDGHDVVTRFDRDDLGRIVAEVQDGARVGYTLDARGRVKTRELPPEAEGQKTHYAYDRLGACTQVVHEGPFGRHVVDFERDALGREARRRTTTATETPLEMVRTYDAMDRLLEQQVATPQPGGAAPKVLSHRRLRYDRNGRPTTIEDTRWGTTQYRYDPLGQLLEASRGPAQHEVFDYDVTGSLRNILTEAGATALGWQLEPGNVLVEKNGVRYENDLCKRRVRKVEPGGRDGEVAGGADCERVTEYGWDVRDRLREVKLPDGRRAKYRYDAFARRVSKTIVAATSLATQILTATPAASETTRFLYDGDVLASEIRDGGHGGSDATSERDGVGAGDGSSSAMEGGVAPRTAAAAIARQMSAAGDTTDAPAGSKVDGGTSGGYVRVHVHEAGSFVPLLQVEQGEVFTVVNDHLGMPKELVDTRGQIAWTAAHGAWGNITETACEPGTAEVASPFRLLGQYADEETGLSYTRFRYFDPQAARWCSPDPIGIEGGRNLGGFDASPSLGVDPFGLSCRKPPFGNTMAGFLDSELLAAKEHGVKPLRPGEPGFATMVSDPNVTIKWAVDTEGNVAMIPSRVGSMTDLDADLKHSVIFAGRDVLAAGEGQFFVDNNGKVTALSVNPRSGHYLPTGESVHTGASAMRRSGIAVPKSSVSEEVPWE